MDYRASVLGATGAVGSALVRELLASPRCTQVTTLGRRAVDSLAGVEGADKLSARVVDLAELERETAEAARGSQTAFCTLGVGQPRKVSREELWKVDVEYASAFARGCKSAGVRHLSLLTSASADAKSSTYYLRVKGAIEEAVRALDFPRTSFFRPGLLVTREMRYGLQDRVTQTMFPLLSWALPRRWHQIEIEKLARAMRVNAEKPQAATNVEVLHYDDFLRLQE